jgi:hypothetical protein
MTRAHVVTTVHGRQISTLYVCNDHTVSDFLQCVVANVAHTDASHGFHPELSFHAIAYMYLCSSDKIGTIIPHANSNEIVYIHVEHTNEYQSITDCECKER